MNNELKLEGNQANEGYDAWANLANENESNLSEQNHEEEKQKETPAELRARFIDQAKRDNAKTFFDEKLSLRGELDILEMGIYSRMTRGEWPDATQELLYLGQRANYIETVKKKTSEGGEWDPEIIAEKYGNQVEKYGISLADISHILSKSHSSEEKTINPSKLFPEYFCENIPNVIERHFSENVDDKHKQLLSTIIRKEVEYDRNRSDYWKKLRANPDLENKIQEPEKAELSEEEAEFLAKEYVNANKEVNKSPNMYVFRYHGMPAIEATNDKLLDGIMCGIYDFYANEFRYQKVGKKIMEYL